MSIPVTLNSLEILNGLIEHEPAWWVDTCAQIATGTPYYKIAEVYNIKPALFRGWIGGNPQREKDYLQALEYRKEYRNEKAGHRLAEFVDAKVNGDDINPTHVLAAIEKTIGKSGIGVTVDTGGGNVTIIHESA